MQVAEAVVMKTVKARSLRESVRFVLPSVAALGLLGGCSSGSGATNQALDNSAPDGKGALHTLAKDDPSLPDGSDEPGAAPADAVQLSGTLSGFWGPCEPPITCSNQVVLQNNGGDDLTLSDNGVFTFAKPLSPGQGYAVTVLSQPPTVGEHGGQTCVVSAGTGVACSQGVTDVVVNCTTNQYTIGGTVSGLLAGAGLSLYGYAQASPAPTGGQSFLLEQSVLITGDGSPSQTFTFPTPVQAGSYYFVRVLGNPPAPRGKSCAPTGANAQGPVQGAVSGNALDANITNLEVSCTTLPYLYSFEAGTEGWSTLGYGEMMQSPDFHTEGLFGLKIIALVGATWFGATYDAPIDLSGKTHLKWDVETDVVPTTQELAVQTGDNWTWCQGGGWPWLDAGATTTMDVDLTNLDCNADLSQVHALYIYFTNGGGNAGRNERIYYLDNVRAE
jgi:hypothetical protein